MSLVGLGGRGKGHRLCRINLALLLARRGIRHEAGVANLLVRGTSTASLAVEARRQAVATCLNGAATGASLGGGQD